MRFLIPIVLGLLVFGMAVTVGFGQEKLSEAEAQAEIKEMRQCEEEALAKIAEEREKVDALEAEVAELADKIAALRAQIAKLKKKYDIYVVKEGDWLSKLAEYPEVYGKGNYAMWPKIYKANGDLIKDPDLIYPDWELKIPRP